MQERLYIIHNPTAGSQLAREERAGVRRVLDEMRRALQPRHEWVETRSPEDARMLARHAAAEGFRRVVAIGGDGTVHEVVNGLMSVPHHMRPKLGILPVGSGNDFAFALGLPTDLRQALDVILRGTSRAVDIGKIEDDLGRTEYFDNTIGIGFDAKVTEQAQKIKKLRGFSRYFAATLQTIAQHHVPFEVDLTIDRHRMNERVLMLTIGNGPREGGGFLTTPSSKVDDGVFELLMITPISRPRMLALLPKVLRGKHLESASVYHRTFSTMQVTSPTPLCIHTDGELFGDNTHVVKQLTITMEMRVLGVMV